MSTKAAPANLADIIKELRNKIGSKDVDIKDLFSIFSSRVYGPMLLVPSLLAVLPTGAVPGVPTLCGIIVTLVSVQLLFGVEHPWLPKKLKSIRIPKEKLEKSLDILEKPVQVLEKYVKPRFTYLTEQPWLKGMGFLCATLGLSMAPLELMPFAVMLPGASILLFSVGLIMRDGIWLILGMLTSLISYWLAFQALSGIFS